MQRQTELVGYGIACGDLQFTDYDGGHVLIDSSEVVDFIACI